MTGKPKTIRIDGTLKKTSGLSIAKTIIIIVPANPINVLIIILLLYLYVTVTVVPASPASFSNTLIIFKSGLLSI